MGKIAFKDCDIDIDSDFENLIVAFDDGSEDGKSYQIDILSLWSDDISTVYLNNFDQMDVSVVRYEVILGIIPLEIDHLREAFEDSVETFHKAILKREWC